MIHADYRMCLLTVHRLLSGAFIPHLGVPIDRVGGGWDAVAKCRRTVSNRLIFCGIDWPAPTLLV